MLYSKYLRELMCDRDGKDIGDNVAGNLVYHYVWCTRFWWMPSGLWYRFRKWLHWEFGLHKLDYKFEKPGVHWCKFCGKRFYE